MINRALFLAASAIITAILFVPQDSGGITGLINKYASSDRGDAQVAVVSEGNAAWSRGETVLTRQNGHFFADTRVSGTEINMMVDTGASFVALTGEDAEALGLFWDEDESIVVAQGASGPVRGIPVRLDEVEVGEHMVRDVRAAIIPEGLGVSLLGQSFLSGVKRVEIADDRMILSGE